MGFLPTRKATPTLPVNATDAVADALRPACTMVIKETAPDADCAATHAPPVVIVDTRGVPGSIPPAGAAVIGVLTVDQLYQLLVPTRMAMSTSAFAAYALPRVQLGPTPIVRLGSAAELTVVGGGVAKVWPETSPAASKRLPARITRVFIGNLLSEFLLVRGYPAMKYCRPKLFRLFHCLEGRYR